MKHKSELSNLVLGLNKNVSLIVGIEDVPVADGQGGELPLAEIPLVEQKKVYGDVDVKVFVAGVGEVAQQGVAVDRFEGRVAQVADVRDGESPEAEARIAAVLYAVLPPVNEADVAGIDHQNTAFTEPAFIGCLKIQVGARTHPVKYQRTPVGGVAEGHAEIRIEDHLVAKG